MGGGYFIFQKFYKLRVLPRIYCAGNMNLGGIDFKDAESLIKILVEKIEKQGFSFSVETEMGTNPYFK